MKASETIADPAMLAIIDTYIEKLGTIVTETAIPESEYQGEHYEEFLEIQSDLSEIRIAYTKESLKGLSVDFLFVIAAVVSCFGACVCCR